MDKLHYLWYFLQIMIAGQISLDVRLTIGGMTTGLRDWQQKRQTPLSDYKLFQYRSGTGATSFDGQWYEHQPNEIVLVPAHKQVRHRSTGVVSLGWIHFRPLSPRFDALLRSIQDVTQLAVIEEDILPWRAIGETLRQPNDLMHLHLRNEVVRWCLQVVQQVGIRELPSEDPVIAVVVQYIEHHYHERPTLADLAAVAGWSQGYLHKRFSETYGHSPRVAIERLLMNDVADDLRFGSISLDQLADRYRFADRFHLSKAIRRHFGMTATQLRSSMLGKP